MLPDRLRSALAASPLLRRLRYPLSESARVAMTCRCRDCEGIPKVEGAGGIMDFNGERVQIMHEGTKVVAGGYYGDWISRIIANLRGHHEPQEELVFHHLLKHVRPGSLMVEVGSYWAYYTNWFLGAVAGGEAVCLEPDAAHIECGRRNMEINGRRAAFINACVGAQDSPSQALRRESDGRTVHVPCHDMNGVLRLVRGRPVEILHIDAQGAEVGFLSSMREVAADRKVRFVMVSTHHESISGSPQTHDECRRLLLRMGAIIMAEHTIEESFSGDGLIAASLSRDDRGLCLPCVSLNRAEDSLFGRATAEPDIETVRTRFGPMILSRGDKEISRRLRANGRFEEGKIEEVVAYLCERFAYSPGVFVDIGANIGTHIVSAMNSGRFDAGIAIEMEDANFALLSANLALNGLSKTTRAFQLALSDKESEAAIELSADNFGDHRLRATQTPVSGRFGEQNRFTVPVRTTTLDRLAELESITFGRDHLVWIDTQGHDGHVLAGASKILHGSSAPFVVCEVWPYGVERAAGRELLFQFLERCAAIFDINAPSWTAKPPISLDAAHKLYNTILASREPHLLHTDFLCVLASF